MIADSAMDAGRAQRSPGQPPSGCRYRNAEWQRRREYGESTAALVINPEANGAEGLFNQALSNGLAAIMSPPLA